MKKLSIIFAIFILASFRCSTAKQTVYTKYKIDSYEVTISSVLEKYVHEFVTKAKHYGVNTDGIGHLDYILYIETKLLYTPTYWNVYGITNTMPPHSHVIINSSTVDLVDSAFLRLVVFHELGHAVGVMHVKGFGEPHLMRSGAYIDAEYLIKNFDKKLEKQFFEYLKKAQKIK